MVLINSVLAYLGNSSLWFHSYSSSDLFCPCHGFYVPINVILGMWKIKVTSGNLVVLVFLKAIVRERGEGETFAIVG